jgi:hypothetical protein
MIEGWDGWEDGMRRVYQRLVGVVEGTSERTSS